MSKEMSLPLPRWTVKWVEGTALERCLNDLDGLGYEVEEIIHYTTRPVQHPLDQTKVGMVPMFVVVARMTFIPVMQPRKE